MEGDRMIVNGLPVRLYGIDAPETGQQCRSARGAPFDCGEAARAVLERMIGSSPVQCSIFSVATSGDQIGLCKVGGADLGARMVAGGWAFPQRRLSNRYEAMEARAQSAGAGLWAGLAERPWLWRRRQGG
ncbi:MAG: thermonuclease family protein [Inquilinus sp.]|nr:thermonuclease family protein [Inquilinus sp.]